MASSTVVRIVFSLPACPPHAMFALVISGMIAASVPAPSPRSLLKSIEPATPEHINEGRHARYRLNGSRGSAAGSTEGVSSVGGLLSERPLADGPSRSHRGRAKKTPALLSARPRH